MKHMNNIDTTDPLNTNCNDIDTSYPRLPAAVYDLKIASIKKEPTKDGSGDRLTVVLETTSLHKSTTGEDIQPGLKITHYIGITEKPARTNDKGVDIRPYTNADIAKGISSLVKSAGGNTSPLGFINNPSQLEGRTVRTKIKIQKETPEFPESNRVGEFVVVK